ncbi:MAG: DNA polymerase III subunit delta [Wenzhouxiangellaceae bacterium]|nr:DNA polymerase III subunit delta [Wenzhouxiangellaceae bacterium]
MKVTPERLDKQLAGGLAPIYLLAGPERLIVEEAADAIRRAAREQQVSERIALTADGRFDWSELERATETGSLFASRRLVELRVPTGKPGAEGGKALRAWVEAGRDDVLLVMCDQWDWKQEKSVWFQAIERSGVFLAARTVKPHELPGWIGQRLRRAGFSADRAVCEFLAARLEGNLLAAAQEVDRLALLFASGPLTLAQVREAVADSARFDAFRLTELTLIGQAGAALRCIRGLRESGVAQVPILWALGRELDVAARIVADQRPAADIYRDLKIWPARQKPIDALVHRLGRVRIAECLIELSRLDLQTKGQAPGDFWVALERFVVTLAQVPNRSAA